MNIDLSPLEVVAIFDKLDAEGIVYTFNASSYDKLSLAPIKLVLELDANGGAELILSLRKNGEWFATLKDVPFPWSTA